jgi:hypothetical protein
MDPSFPFFLIVLLGNNIEDNMELNIRNKKE